MPLQRTGLRYDHIIATGGIGSGIFFALSGDHTLGRNESRMGTLLPYADYCKQHIILHYIAVLLGSNTQGPFTCFPVGKVGKDEVGMNLIKQMNAAGMNTEFVKVSENHRTLFSVCYQYPDKAGGNITNDNSACSDVSSSDISSFFKAFKHTGKQEIILAAPEVPMSTRLTLLETGRQRGSFNVASIQSSEVDAARMSNFFSLVDLLSINIDEASAIAKISNDSADARVIVETCVSVLTDINPAIRILITDGANGNYCYETGRLAFTPGMKVPVSSTAGAGDAFLAGTIVGICAGLPLMTNKSDNIFSETPLETAVELGTLLASMSVTSHDSIHPTANAETLYQFAKEKGVIFCPDVSALFEGYRMTPSNDG